MPIRAAGLRSKPGFGRLRQAYEELKPEDRSAYDAEKLTNPYADSRILHGDPDREVRTVLVGIDIETPEILLADRLESERQRHRPGACSSSRGAGLCQLLRSDADAGRDPASVRRSDQCGRRPAGEQDEGSGAKPAAGQPYPSRGCGPPSRYSRRMPPYSGRQHGRFLSAGAVRQGAPVPSEGYPEALEERSPNIRSRPGTMPGRGCWSGPRSGEPARSLWT